MHLLTLPIPTTLPPVGAGFEFRFYFRLSNNRKLLPWVAQKARNDAY
jgi:hypothetical protein